MELPKLQISSGVIDTEGTQHWVNGKVKIYVDVKSVRAHVSRLSQSFQIEMTVFIQFYRLLFRDFAKIIC